MGLDWTRSCYFPFPAKLSGSYCENATWTNIPINYIRVINKKNRNNSYTEQATAVDVAPFFVFMQFPYRYSISALHKNCHDEQHKQAMFCTLHFLELSLIFFTSYINYRIIIRNMKMLKGTYFFYGVSRSYNYCCVGIF